MAIDVAQDYKAVSVQPLTHVIGAEIEGVDLRHELSDDAMAEIRRAVVTHCVVFFRDQQITMEQYEAFASRFGPIYKQSYGFGAIAPGTEGLSVLDAPAFKGKGEGWHVDELWTMTPPSMATLRAVELPPYGGDTAWSSMYEAYDQLSEAMKTFLDPLKAFYPTPGQSARERIKDLGDSDAPEILEKRERFQAVLKKAESMVAAEHGLVGVHPGTGRKYLYFSKGHVGYVCGLTAAESTWLLEFLARHIQLIQFQYRNQWSVGDIALWDERCAQHAVVPDYDGVRKLWRLYIAST